MTKLNRHKKWLPLVLILVFMISLTGPVTITAQEAPYTTITVDKDGRFVETLDGYVPSKVVDNFDGERLKKPEDLFIAESGNIYIADTGNRRILILNEDMRMIGEISEGLKGPTGVYVNEAGQVYVADPKAQAVFMYEADGSLLRTYEKPVSPIFGEESKYKPTKLIVDKAGSLYVLSEGNANGILNISSDGEFFGYFGANATTITFNQLLRRLTFTEAQRASLQKNVPSSALNIDQDTRGLIYTVTQGTQPTEATQLSIGAKNGISKYNIAGENMLSPGYVDNLIQDVAVGSIENIYAVSKEGFIYEYTRDQELLFLFAGKDDGTNRAGLFNNIAAIDTDSEDNLYVLDADGGDITCFIQTEYSLTVHEALRYYQDGFYVESQEPWNKVLSMNSLFDYAYKGLGKADYKLENYDKAMEESRIGGDRRGYSNSFWQVRNVFIRDNLILFFGIWLVLVALLKLNRRFGKKVPGLREVNKGIDWLLNRKLVREIRFIKGVLRNPADAYYGIKWENKVSILSASIIYLGVFTIYILNKYMSGFIFKTINDNVYELGKDAIFIFGFIGLFIFCNHLISDIRDGEGSIKNIYMSFAYSFMPYIFLKPAVIILTHILSNNERFIIELLNFLIYAGVAILTFIMVKEIQDYTIGETIKSLLITFFTMFILVAIGFIFFALAKQVGDFVFSIFKEVYYRGR